MSIAPAKSILVVFPLSNRRYGYLVPAFNSPRIGDFVVTNRAMFNANNPLALSDNPDSAAVFGGFGVARVVEIHYDKPDPSAKKEYIQLLSLDHLTAREAGLKSRLAREKAKVEAQAKLDAIVEQFKKEAILDMVVRTNPEARRLYEIVTSA